MVIQEEPLPSAGFRDMLGIPGCYPYARMRVGWMPADKPSID